MECSDGTPQLSMRALDALQDFYDEQNASESLLDHLKRPAEDDPDDGPFDMKAFPEDWNASQFWYSNETATIFASQLLHQASNEDSIAVVSTPSVFVQLKNLVKTRDDQSKPELMLLEYDERFSIFSEYIAYDYHHPVRLPTNLQGKFNCIICDPPFLSDDCQAKVALTVRWLSVSTGARIIVCTGERTESTVRKLYSKDGVRTTDFDVKHASGLSNEWRCFANFQCEEWKFVPEASA